MTHTNMASQAYLCTKQIAVSVVHSRMLIRIPQTKEFGWMVLMFMMCINLIKLTCRFKSLALSAYIRDSDVNRLDISLTSAKLKYERDYITCDIQDKNFKKKKNKGAHQRDRQREKGKGGGGGGALDLLLV